MFIDSEGKEIGRKRSVDFDPQILQEANHIPETAPTFTSILKSVLPFDERIKVHTKHHKWKLIVSSGWKGAYLPEPLLNYRMHDRNLSGIGRIFLEHPSYETLLQYWALKLDE